jgi:hypothetical protein
MEPINGHQALQWDCGHGEIDDMAMCFVSVCAIISPIGFCLGWLRRDCSVENLLHCIVWYVPKYEQHVFNALI